MQLLYYGVTLCKLKGLLWHTNDYIVKCTCMNDNVHKFDFKDDKLIECVELILDT